MLQIPFRLSHNFLHVNKQVMINIAKTQAQAQIGSLEDPLASYIHRDTSCAAALLLPPSSLV